MRTAPKVFRTVSEGSVLFLVVSWALEFLLAVQKRDIFDKPLTSTVALTLGTLIVFIPDGLAAVWVFRRLRVLLSRSEASRATIAFAISAPVTLAIAYPLSLLVGGYAEVFLGSRFFLVCILAFVMVMMILIPNGVVRWAPHPSGGVEPVPANNQK